jgi:hypothetical protein
MLMWEQVGDTKSRKSKDRWHQSQAKKDKRTNNDSQNNTQKTNDGATRTPLKIENGLVGVAGTAPDKIVLDLSIRK